MLNNSITKSEICLKFKNKIKNCEGYFRSKKPINIVHFDRKEHTFLNVILHVHFDVLTFDATAPSHTFVHESN